TTTPVRTRLAGVGRWRTDVVPRIALQLSSRRRDARPTRPRDRRRTRHDRFFDPTDPRRRRRPAAFSALLAGLLVWTLPAGPASAQSGVERLTNKVDRLQRELNDLQRRVYSGEGGEQSAPANDGGQASGGSAGMTQAAAARGCSRS
ncbi:MAG: hypothetical protein U5L06_03565, partial [Rhodovibrio sp.]|nr:hypothetical protein [Rhodovibrio sp.]